MSVISESCLPFWTNIFLNSQKRFEARDHLKKVLFATYCKSGICNNLLKLPAKICQSSEILSYHSDIRYFQSTCIPAYYQSLFLFFHLDSSVGNFILKAEKDSVDLISSFLLHFLVKGI